ncbi:hypothetical protein D3C80_1668010 [compost metagenome]
MGWLCLVRLLSLDEVLSIWSLVVTFDAEFQAVADDILDIVFDLAMGTEWLDIHLILRGVGFFTKSIGNFFGSQAALADNRVQVWTPYRFVRGIHDRKSQPV